MSSELWDAIAAGDLAAVRRIVAERPAAARARNDQGVSAVMFALYRWQHAIAAELRPHAGPLDVFEAAAIGDAERVAELLASDPSLAGVYAPDGFTPLHLAAFFARDDAARTLIARGAEVGAVSRNQMTNQPLHAAAAGGSVEICRLLLENGADVNARQQGGYTPLHEAAHRADLEMIDLFLEAGAEKAAKSDDGKTPRDMAVDVGEGPAAEKLGN
jgi:ankyrin repeat protein